MKKKGKNWGGKGEKIPRGFFPQDFIKSTLIMFPQRKKNNELSFSCEFP